MAFSGPAVGAVGAAAGGVGQGPSAVAAGPVGRDAVGERAAPPGAAVRRPGLRRAGECVGDAVAVGAAAASRGGVGDVGVRRTPAEYQPTSDNACGSTAGSIFEGESSCRPVHPDQRCYQSGNPHTDRIDPSRSYVCALDPDASRPSNILGNRRERLRDSAVVVRRATWDGRQ